MNLLYLSLSSRIDQTPVPALQCWISLLIIFTKEERIEEQKTYSRSDRTENLFKHQPVSTTIIIKRDSITYTM